MGFNKGKEGSKGGLKAKETQRRVLISKLTKEIRPSLTGKLPGKLSMPAMALLLNVHANLHMPSPTSEYLTT